MHECWQPCYNGYHRPDESKMAWNHVHVLKVVEREQKCSDYNYPDTVDVGGMCCHLKDFHDPLNHSLPSSYNSCRLVSRSCRFEKAIYLTSIFKAFLAHLSFKQFHPHEGKFSDTMGWLVNVSIFSVHYLFKPGNPKLSQQPAMVYLW